MVAVTVSAFEMYQQAKQAKKKSSKKKKKDKNLTVNPLLAAELQKAAELSKTNELSLKKKKKKATALNGASLENSSLKAAEGEESIDMVQDNVGSSFSKFSSPKKNKKKKKKIAAEKGISEQDSPRTASELLSEVAKGKGPDDDDDEIEVESPSFKLLNPKKMKKKMSAEENLPPEGNSKERQLVSSLPSVHLSHLPNSIEIAEELFSWMLDPINKDTFFSSYWEKRPVHVSREGNRTYYKRILSTSAIDNMLRKHSILFGKNVDITSYCDGKRETLNSVGRAHAAIVWDYYRNGCSVRLLNPQTYHNELRDLNTRLQEVFGSFVGANAYLTPPNSQGFAPHYDDIEAFVLQIEGQKLWRIYSPRCANEKLPRTSSPNFTQEEIGEPIMEVLVKAGDLLYFPRGFIHQASTVPGHHSLHVTVSTYQRNSWADFLEKLVPAALANAIEEDEEFRKGMPLNILNHVGVVHSESESPERTAVMGKLKKLFSKLFDYAPVDAAADQMAKEYIHDCLPPLLSSDEKKCSVLENSERMGTDGKLSGTVQLTSETCIRLTRSNVLRLVSEEEPDSIKIYHAMENSLEYHGEDPQCIEIPLNYAPAVEHLISSYPDFIAVSELPLEEDTDKILVATELWERGLLLTECPLQDVSFDQ